MQQSTVIKYQGADLLSGFSGSQEILSYPYDVKTEGKMVAMKLGVENYQGMLFGLNKTVVVTPWPFRELGFPVLCY